MIAILLRRAKIAAFSAVLAAELDHLVVRLNVWSDKEHNADGTHNFVTVNGLTFNGDTQTTVGAAGGASALPATPSRYMEITVDGVDYVMPLYLKS
jgi:hypothetical protein